MTRFSDLMQTFDTDPANRERQFKLFSRWFLRNDPDSGPAIESIWLWQDYPDRWNPDSTIDLVFRRKNGEVWAVFARGYPPDHEIKRNDIAAFLQESDRKGIDKRLVIATTDRIAADARQVCNAQVRKVLLFLRADFDSANLTYPRTLAPLLEQKEPGQTKAAAVVVDRLEKDTKGEAAQASYRFSDMELGVGDRLQLQLPAMLGQDRHVVRMIGYIKGVSVMVSAPLGEDGLPLELVEGEQVVVRLFSALAVYGFGATVIRVCKGPVPHLHLEYPAEVQGRVIRAERRIRTGVITAVSVVGSDAEPVPAVIVNLSPTGCLIDAQRKVGERDTRVRLSLKLDPHGHEHVIELDALIRSVDATPGSTETRHGIKFNTLPAHDSLVLNSYIYHHLVEQPESAM